MSGATTQSQSDDAADASLFVSLSRRHGRARAKVVRGLASRLIHDPALLAPILILVALVLFAIVVPLVWSSPYTQRLGASLQVPSAAHPFGTDDLGRDILARVATGAQISLSVAALIALAGAFFGGLIGLAAGALSGWVDTVSMRIIDAILAFPSLILAMGVAISLGVGLRSAAIGITIATIPQYSRLVRSEAVRLRALPYVEAAAAIGASRTRILARHVVPHILPTLAIQTAGVFGWAILAIAALGFLGLGAQVPTPEWGTMITEGLGYALTGQWWIALFPGILILLAASAANLISDRIRDILDPRGDMVRL